MTVMGVHKAPNAPDTSAYDYDKLAHDKKTGSMDIEQRTCDGTPGDPHTRTPIGCCSLIMEFLPDTPTPPARQRPVSSNDLGYNVYPDGSEVDGDAGVYDDNWIITNAKLECISQNICAVKSAIENLTSAVDDFDVNFQMEMEKLISAIQGLQLNVDTGGLEDAIRDHTQTMHDMWQFKP